MLKRKIHKIDDSNKSNFADREMSMCGLYLHPYISTKDWNKVTCKNCLRRKNKCD